jgi:hypothetical protein
MKNRYTITIDFTSDEQIAKVLGDFLDAILSAHPDIENVIAHPVQLVDI